MYDIYYINDHYYINGHYYKKVPHLVKDEGHATRNQRGSSTGACSLETIAT